MKILGLFAIVALLLLRGAPEWRAGRSAAPAPTAGLTERQWTVDGVQRDALLYVPPTATSRKTPVVFAFHGHGGNMRNADRSFGIETLWPDAIVVYMEGLPTPGQLTDAAGNRNGWQRTPGDQGDRDLHFFDAVLASLKKDYQVDDAHVFATGHSNGGSFCYVLWAARGSVLRAVAPSSAVPGRSTPGLTPKPVLHLAGENDPLVRYAWQERTFTLLKRLDSCDAAGKPWAKSGPINGTEYPSKSGTPVVTLVHPGGHVIPKEAPALIVKFFKEVS